MSPAFLDTRAPARMQNPNPNGQFSSSSSSFNFFELSSNNYHQMMSSSSKVVNENSGFSNSNETKSDFSFNSPSVPLSGSASASGLSKPRLSKTRRHPGLNNPRSSSSSSSSIPESWVNPGFNPFRPDLKTVSSGVVTREGNEAFAFGVIRSDSDANSSSGSSGNVGIDVIDEMRELNIGREEGVTNVKGSGLDFDSSSRTNLNVKEGLSTRGFVYKGGSNKKWSSDESEVSDEMRKLNIGNSSHGESVGKKDTNISFSANDKARFGHGFGDNVASSIGKNMESELPSEFKKLNVKDTSVLDAGGRIFSANEKKKSLFKSNTKGSDSSAGSTATVLPDQMRNLNLKETVNANGVEKLMRDSKTGEETGFIFGGGSLGMRTERKLSDKMGNMKIESGTGDSSIKIDRDFSSHGIFMNKQKTGNLSDKMFHDVGESTPTAFTFETVMPVKDANDRQVPKDHPYDDFKLEGHTSASSFSATDVHFQSSGNISEPPSMNIPRKKDEFHFTTNQNDTGEPHIVFKTPDTKGNLFSSQNQKSEFSARRGAVNNNRSKKGRGQLSRQHNPVHVWLGPNNVMGESSSHEIPVSPVSYSPMDVSPYEETLADNRSRETSVASDNSFHLDESSDLLPTVSNDAMDEDLVSATQRMNISEAGDKCEGKKEGRSEYNFDKGVSAEVHQEESISGTETESFKSAFEELDSNSDTATSFENEANLSSNIENQESDRVQFFSTSSDVTGGTKFIFGSSSSSQGQASSVARPYRKKNRLKVDTDSSSSTTPGGNVLYASSPVQLPFSGNSSLLSPRQSQIGNILALQHRGGNQFKVNKEQEIKQVPTSTSAAAVVAQEACEKWRLRGNQSYSNGDLSKAEDYYTHGVNCVSRSETSRSCLRALMLCYSNRAATRMSLGRMREAVEDCMLAAVIDPSFLRVKIRAANCYLALGEVEEALQFFKKCLEPGSDVSVDRKIMVEASEGIQKAQKVSECMNQSAELIRRRTSIDAESALSIIAEALPISSHSEKLLEMKAEALFLLRKYEEVIQLCEQSLVFAKLNCSPLGGDDQSANPRSVLSKSFSFKLWRFSLIFKSYFYLGKLEEALDLLEKQDGLRKGSKALESSIPLAVIQELLRHKAAGNEAFQSGRHAEAIEHYTAALSSNVESRPFAAICFCNRAAAFKTLGQITDAIADCSLAIALDIKYLKALSRRASLYEMIRDYGQAARDLERLVSFLIKQVEEKTNQSGPADRSTSCVNDLRHAQLRLSEVEGESRKEIPLNMYLILGIEPSVSASEVKKAYRKAALRHHPDKAGQSLARSDNGEDGLWKEIAEEVYKDADRLFKMIGEAYAVISNPSKRAHYDLEEEMRTALKKGNGSSASRTHADVQNYPFERTGSRRHWTEVRKSYWHT